LPARIIVCPARARHAHRGNNKISRAASQEQLRLALLKAGNNRAVVINAICIGVKGKRLLLAGIVGTDRQLQSREVSARDRKSPVLKTRVGV